MVATVSTGWGSMLSAIIATHESERALVPTLAALVPGAAAGLIGEVVIADAGSGDATAEVAEIAGCRFISSNDPLGVRLKDAATSTRGPWLMFLRAGSVPQPGWIDAADHFMQSTDAFGSATRAAVFRPLGAVDHLRPTLREVFALLRSALGSGPGPDQGLLISRHLYEAVGGHPTGADSETALLHRLGRRRIAMLPVAVSLTRKDT
ncbi:MAG TPA: glycosyl transferase [Pseudolabrys sp.]|jgi:glycosyltransferase involved in cell wall biosynthesis|nr:glycosyl transferase [Pseudolabrys sp.]